MSTDVFFEEYNRFLIKREYLNEIEIINIYKD